MKKYKLIALIYWFSFLVIMLLMTANCRTLEKSVHREKESEVINVDLNLDHANDVKTSVSTSELELQRQMFSELVSNLQIDYSGQSDQDKLMFEMKKTIDGLTFEISGKGTAQYEHQEQVNFEEFKAAIIKHHDSLFNQALNTIVKQNETYLSDYFSKEKQVKATGFTLGTYVIIGIGLLLAILLYWLSRR